MSKKILILENDNLVTGALKRLFNSPQNISPLYCATEEAATDLLTKDLRPNIVFINTHFGSSSPQQYSGLIFACFEIRLKRSIRLQPGVVIYSFEPYEKLKEFSYKEFGIDLLSTAGFSFIRLPSLVNKCREITDQFLKAAPPGAGRIRADFHLVRLKIVGSLWREFDHDCRNLSQDKEGWKQLKEKLKPKFEADVFRIEGESEELYAQERQELCEITSDTTPRFVALYELLSRVERKNAVSLRTSLRTPASKDALMSNKPSAVVNATIMVIDDDEDFGQKISADLARMVREIILITNAKITTEQILKRISANKVGVVILDLKFGTIEKGFDVLSEIKRERPATRIILMTGYGSQSDIVIRAKSLGADDFLRKPVAADSLTQKIEGLLIERRVLVIDDHLEEVVTGDFLNLFTAHHCHVYSYSNPGQALIDLEKGAINVAGLHLVLLDLKFGDSFEQGFNAFKRLKGMRKDLPIFILSGFGSDDVIYDVAYNSLKDYFIPPRDSFIVKPLKDEDWASIWAALFPEPEHLILIPSKRRVSLTNAGGTPFAETKLPEKAFVLLHALALKRSRGLNPGIIPPGWEERSEDKELRELKYYTWTGKEISEYRTELNSKIKAALQRDWELVSRASDGSYTLTEQITRVTIKS